MQHDQAEKKNIYEKSYPINGSGEVEYWICFIYLSHVYGIASLVKDISKKTFH